MQENKVKDVPPRLLLGTMTMEGQGRRIFLLGEILAQRLLLLLDLEKKRERCVGVRGFVA